MIGILSKLGVTGCVVSGIIFLNVVPDNSLSENLSIRKETRPKIEVINSIDDIELYEKTHGCSFVFVEGWEANKTRGFYGVKEFLQKEQDAQDYKERWIGNSIKYANQARETCKRDSIVTIFKDGGNFVLERPSGGWEQFNN